MGWSLVRGLGRLYGLLMVTAVGGLVGANVLGLLSAFFFAPENKAEFVQPWMHWGWCGGAVLFLVLAIGRQAVVLYAAWSKQSAVRSPLDVPRDPAQPAPGQKEQPTQPSPPLQTALGFGLAGGLLGLMLGGSLMLLWFSLAYSPWAPQTWASSLEVKMIQERPGAIERPAMTTQHPLAIYLFTVPIVAGAVLGALAGGVGALLGKTSTPAGDRCEAKAAES